MIRILCLGIVGLVGLSTGASFVDAADLVNCGRKAQIEAIGLAQPSVDAKVREMNAAFTACLAPDAHDATMASVQTVKNLVDRQRIDDAEVALVAFFDSADMAIDKANKNLRILAVDLLRKESLRETSPAVESAPSDVNPTLKVIVPVAAKTPVNVPPTDVAVVDDNRIEFVVHTVKKGDTLWDLSRRHYGFGEYWYTIFALNESIIENPRIIEEGQEIRIPKSRV